MSGLVLSIARRFVRHVVGSGAAHQVKDYRRLCPALDDSGRYPSGNQMRRSPVQTFVDVTSNHGEHLYVAERLVVSPSAGIFEPVNVISGAPTGAEAIAVGAVIGHIAGQEVRSPFAGTLMGMFALPGERVQAGQRIAWLRI